MSGPLFDLDGGPITVGQLEAVTAVANIQDRLGGRGAEETRACVVRARTPHGTYVFDVVSIEWMDDDVLMFNLQQVKEDDEHFVIVDELAWHLQHPMSCRDSEAGIEGCRLTGLVQVGVEAGHVVLGRSRVWLDEAGVLLWDDPVPVEVIRP